MTTQLTATSPTRDERTVATISHALSFVEGGILGPVLVYALRKEVTKLVATEPATHDSAFVAFHSLQSFYFGVLFAAFALPVTLVTCGWGLFALVPLYFLFEIIACVRANNGEWYQLPLAGDWALRSHPPGSDTPLTAAPAPGPGPTPPPE